MTIYKWLLHHLILPVGSCLSKGNYLKDLKQWKAYDAKSNEELNAIQKKNLKTILEYALKNVPYYKSIQSPNIESFPILTKDILRNNLDALVSKEYNISKLEKHHSSGSSGVQSFTYMDSSHTYFLRALQTHWWSWSGYEIGDSLLQFGISKKRTPAKLLKDFFYRCTYVKAFGISEKELKNILVNASKKKNLVIAGYPSVIYQLALASKKENIDLNVKSIICFGDKLFDHHVNAIKVSFSNHVKIIDTYGCAEGILMACKIDSGYYHVMSPHVYLEIVDDAGNKIEDGKMGNVLVTCLTNKAMPLIRYKLGDLAIALPRKDYPKARRTHYPLLKKVVGRETDIIKTKDGTIITVHSFTGVLEYYQSIKQYKVIQNSLDKIIIEYVAENSFDLSILKEIKNKLNRLTGESLSIEFKNVALITPSSSGKPQIIESNIK